MQFVGYSYVTSAGTFPFEKEKNSWYLKLIRHLILSQTHQHASRTLTSLSSCSSTIHNIAPIWFKSGQVNPDNVQKRNPVYLKRTPSGICRRSPPGFFLLPEGGCHASPLSWSGQESSDAHSCRLQSLQGCAVHVGRV